MRFSLIIISLSLGIVSKIWAKKSAIGKEEVAKLVDDTYSVASSYDFVDHQDSKERDTTNQASFLK
ncbi:hypothetical protein SADUNF_Sadunf09G0010400 [Salix dunnii]|uniref:Uncharacterized protein n=1 Tax=Salix dunnii TaxID=1413687 RepID=A0A835MSR4_9ROSI|nr:hypothetical protein SADUNF_Sadunf09G0010400 [Salix dunnii]